MREQPEMRQGNIWVEGKPKITNQKNGRKVMPLMTMKWEERGIAAVQRNISGSRI